MINMKKINNYITEKLKLNKDSKTESSDLYEETADYVWNLLPTFPSTIRSNIKNDIKKKLTNYFVNYRIHTVNGYIKKEDYFNEIFKQETPERKKYLKTKYRLDSPKRFDELLAIHSKEGNELCRWSDINSIWYSKRVLCIFYKRNTILFECNPYGELG